MLTVLKLVVCSIFIGKEGQRVISRLLHLLSTFWRLPSQFIRHAGRCLVITGLKSQGNVLSKSIPSLETVRRIQSLKVSLRRESPGQAIVAIFFFFHFDHQPTCTAPHWSHERRPLEIRF